MKNWLTFLWVYPNAERKVRTGKSEEREELEEGKSKAWITGLGQPNVHSDVAFDPSMSVLPLVQKQNLVSDRLLTHKLQKIKD